MRRAKLAPRLISERPPAGFKRPPKRALHRHCPDQTDRSRTWIHCLGSGAPDNFPYSSLFLSGQIPWIMVKRKAAVSPKRSIPLRDSKGYPCQSSSSIVLVVVLGLVPSTPRNAKPAQPHRARYRSRARDRFLPDEGEKKPPSLLSFTSVSQSDSLFTSNGQSSITRTILGIHHPPALPPPNQMFSGCPKLPWSTLGCDVPWHNKVRRHSRTRQEQRRSKKPSESSSFSGLVPPAPNGEPAQSTQSPSCSFSCS
jgi:hypothetical protein